MKKTGIFLLIILFSLNVYAQTPEEFVQKCIDVIGGEGAVKKYADHKAKGEIEVSRMGMQLVGKLESIQKQNRSWRRAEINYGRQTFVMLKAFDGKTAWMDRFGTIVDQPALNYESDFDHDFSLLLEKEATFSLVKEKEIDGKKAVGIEVEHKGKKTTFYIDKETYIVLEMIYEDYYFGESYTKEMLEMRYRFGDHKKVDGVLYPMRMAVYQKGQKQIEIHLDEITFNPQVAVAIFQRPDQKLDLRYSEELIH